MADLSIPAYSYGGGLAALGGVLHDVESPLRAGYAESLARNWFGTPKAGTSAHVIADPRDRVRCVPWTRVAYHAGPKANGLTISIEQAGYASQSRAVWLSADGIAQMDNVIALMREGSAIHGLPMVVTDDADYVRSCLRSGRKFGWCYHDTIRRAVGGTTHTDPTPNYPVDVLRQRIAGSTKTVEGIPTLPGTTKGQIRMRVIQAPGKPYLALVGDGGFTPLSIEEAQAFAASGCAIVAVRAETWDKMREDAAARMAS